MFNLIRRISGSVLPRQDRAWDEDATSNAPTKSRKRLLSTTSEDESAKGAKRARASALDTVEDDTQSDRETTPTTPAPETTEVKEVTDGVKEVEITEAASSTGLLEEQTAANESDAPKPANAVEPTLATNDSTEAETDTTANDAISSESASANLSDVNATPVAAPTITELPTAVDTTAASSTDAPQDILTTKTTVPETSVQQDVAAPSSENPEPTQTA